MRFFIFIFLTLPLFAQAKRVAPPPRVCCQRGSLYTTTELSECVAFGGVSPSADFCKDAEEKKVCCHRGNTYVWDHQCAVADQIPPDKNGKENLCEYWLMPTCCEDPHGVPQLVSFFDCTQWAKGTPPQLSDLSFCLNAAKPVCCDKEIQESHYQVWTRSDLCTGPGQQVLSKPYSDCIKPPSE
jgi:hypothetical protein